MGDDDFENQNQTRTQKKYGDHVNNFTVKGEGTKVTDTGMNMDRGCTDILMLVLFFAMIGSMGYFTHMGS